MTDSTSASETAIAAFERWSDAFNARDADAQIAEMHFPHVRLADNRFQHWETSDDFRARQEAMSDALRREGWHHTATDSVEAVQVGPTKVHLALRQSRRREDDSEYTAFDTLWIFTLIDGRWGVQFRSSYLSGAVDLKRA